MSLERDVKEVIRDSIARLGLSRTSLQLRRAAGQNVDHLFRPTLAERFSAIYQNRVWLNGRPAGSPSGLGSDPVNTDHIRDGLPALLTQLKTQTLLDVGCGEFLWKGIDLDCQYIGIDIVENVIAANNRTYASASRTFQTLDATLEALPNADTILCREVLFHLSFADIQRLLANIKRSRAIFLVATNDGGLRYNADIESGDFRLLNLHRAPLRLPPAMMSTPDDKVSPGRTLSVWKTSELTNLQCRNAPNNH